MTRKLWTLSVRDPAGLHRFAIDTCAMTMAFRSFVSVFLLDSTLRLSPPLAMGEASCFCPATLRAWPTNQNLSDDVAAGNFSWAKCMAGSLDMAAGMAFKIHLIAITERLPCCI